MMSSVMQYFNGGIKVRRLLVGLKAAITAGAVGIANAVGFDGLVGIFTTVAASGTGKMPPWQLGRLAMVWNQGANAMTLYSAEGATIPVPYAQKVQFASATGGLTAGDTGISLASGAFMLLVGSLDATGVYPVWNEAAFGVSAGVFNGTVGATTPNTGAFTTISSSGLASLNGLTLSTIETPANDVGVTASTTQTLIGGTPLTGQVNQISVTANTGDSVTLPALAVGQSCLVINSGGHNAWVYPHASGVAIDGGAAGAKVVLTTLYAALFTCVATNTIVSSGRGTVSS